MKSLSVLLLSACVVLSSCKDERVSSHEKRIADLEAKVKTLEETLKTKSMNAEVKSDQLYKCVEDANSAYESSLRTYGDKNGFGDYIVPEPKLQQIQREKQGKLDECKLLYK